MERGESAVRYDTILHEQFEAAAKSNPDAIAVVSGDEQLSFRELNRRANQLAHFLIEIGIQGEGNTVGVCLDRSAELIVSLIAVLKTGASYVPIDPHYPEARQLYMLTDSKASLVIIDRPMNLAGSHIPELNINHWYGCELDEPIEPKRSKNPKVARCTGWSRCYTIYTSGSTGTPKGVMGVQRATMNRFGWMYKDFPLTQYDVGVCKTSICFVDSSTTCDSFYSLASQLLSDIACLVSLGNVWTTL
jgi:non-ribosomal peptide synthetase component F